MNMTRLNRIACALFLAVAVWSTPALAQSSFPDAVGFVESATLPIRVYYEKVEKEPTARLVLADLEAAWSRVVDGMGYAAPYTVDDALNVVTGARFYLVSGSGYYAYAIPMADIPSTSRTDCATVIAVSDGIPDWYRPNVVGHGFGHALQMSVDCIEAPFAYEQNAVAIDLVGFPDDPYFPLMLADFQDEPYMALDGVSSDTMYHYGAGLFSYFLDQEYGDGDGKLIARTWALTSQDGTVNVGGYMPTSAAENEPDLLDAIRAVLAENGVSFDDALTAFAVSRYFTGGRDDGAHLPNAAAWTGSELSVDTVVALRDLPVYGATPAIFPEGLGMSYIAFDLTGAGTTAALRLSFMGEPRVSWRATALVIQSGPAVEYPIALNTERAGSVFIPIAEGMQEVVLAVVNLGLPDHDADDGNTESSVFAYSAVLLDCAPMTITGASPGEVVAGEKTTVTLTGEGFPLGQVLTATVSGDGIVASNVSWRDSSTVVLTLEADDNAPKGRRDITLESECGVTAVGAGVVKVVDAGGCQSAPYPGWTWILLAMSGVVVSGLRRRIAAKRR